MTNADLIGSGTTIEIFEGITKLSRVTSSPGNGQYTVTSAVSPEGKITVGAIGGTTTTTVADHTGMAADTNVVVITYTINGKRLDGDVFTVTTTQTITKAKTGQVGNNAKTIRLSSTSQTFRKSKTTGDLTPSSITFTTDRQNITENVVYTSSSNAPLTSVSNTGATLTSSSFGTNTSVRYTATADSLSDSITIILVEEGSDTVQALLSNEAHVIPTDSNGLNPVLGGSGTTIQVFEGDFLLTFETGTGVPSTSGRYRITTGSVGVSGGAITGGETTTTTVGDLTSMSSDVGTRTFTINVRKRDSTTLQLTKVQSFAKSKAGEDGATGATGPGLVYRGEWEPGKEYIKTDVRRDIVFYEVANNDSYWITKKTHTSNIQGNEPANSEFWETFESTFESIATSFILTENAVATRTISVGENGSISIVGGSGGENGTSTINPYISIGQGIIENNQGFNKPGIFLGITGGSSTKGSGTGSFSISGSNGALKWNGASLDITGSLDVTGDSKISGTVTVGTTSTVKIGPGATPADVTGAGINPQSGFSTDLPEIQLLTDDDASPGATAPDYVTPVSSTVITNFTFNITDSSNKLVKVSGTVTPGTNLDASSELRSADGFIEVFLFNGSTEVASTVFGYSVIRKSGPPVTYEATGGGTYELYHTIPNNDQQTYTIRTRTTINNATQRTEITGGVVLDLGELTSTTFTLFPPPNMAINNTGIFVNYGDGVRSLLDLALSDGTSVVSGGGGGGGTNLGTAIVATNSRSITSSTGTDVTVPVVTTTVAGFMSHTDKTKLDGIQEGATANSTNATLLDRANHTGTQTAATISDFQTAVSNNTNVTANTAKVTNATHTGDVTGATALTIGDGKVTTEKIANNAVTNAKAADMAVNTIKGRIAAGTGDPEDLSVNQARALLSVPDGRTAGTVNEFGFIIYSGITRTPGQFYGGTTNPTSTTRLNYDGHFHITQATANNFILSSDRRLKSDIIELNGGLDLVSKLKPMEYIKSENKEFGFITDEIPEELDFLVKRSGEYEALDYISMIGILVKSVQELKRELDTIKKNMK